MQNLWVWMPILYLLKKKSMCKWTCVQTRIIQGSTVVQSSVLRAVMSISRGCGTGARRKEPIYAWCEQVMRKMKRDRLVENGAGAAQGSGKGVSIIIYTRAPELKGRVTMLQGGGCLMCDPESALGVNCEPQLSPLPILSYLPPDGSITQPHF